MNVDSLQELERFFNEHLDDELHKPKYGGLLFYNTGYLIFAIGSYIGEVIIKEYGGEWITNANNQSEIHTAIKLPNETLIFPVQEVIKRIENHKPITEWGEENEPSDSRGPR
jgi:hypothetical protein